MGPMYAMIMYESYRVITIVIHELEKPMNGGYVCNDHV